MGKFCNHFKSLNESNWNDNFDIINVPIEGNEFLNADITETEILKYISNLNNSKAPSPKDNIINVCIKTTKHIFLPIYMYIELFHVETGFLPPSWMEGFIIPVFKNKRNSSDSNNYRPITILSCLGKRFTAVLRV